MRKEVRLCDHCRTDITGGGQAGKPYTLVTIRHHHPITVDLCPDCLKEFEGWLKENEDG